MKKTARKVITELCKFAKANNVAFKEVPLETLLDKEGIQLRYDNEHDYKNFLAALEIGDYYCILFGVEEITDWKWIGYKENDLKFVEMCGNIIHGHRRDLSGMQ
jgi:hypothetical protein